MIESLLVFTVSLIVLLKSADLMVDAAARLAGRLGVSDLIVGLVITSIGTSLPELSSSIAATLADSPGLIVGNVVGSNIANIGLVLGIAALVRPFRTERKTHDRDGFILVASAALLFVLTLDNRIGRFESGFLLATYAAYVVFAARTDREDERHRFQDFLHFMASSPGSMGRFLVGGWFRDPARGQPPTPAGDREAVAGDDRSGEVEVATEGAHGLPAVLGRLSLGLLLVVVSARFVVAESIVIATRAGIPENLIGLSLVAVGTSLPELLVSVSAARKGNSGMLLGNVIGSNVANTLLIVGAAGLIRPLGVPELSVVYTIPIMLFFTLSLLHFIRSDWRVSRSQGALAVVAYAAFLAAAFVQGWG